MQLLSPPAANLAANVVASINAVKATFDAMLAYRAALNHDVADVDKFAAAHNRVTESMRASGKAGYAMQYSMAFMLDMHGPFEVTYKPPYGHTRTIHHPARGFYAARLFSGQVFEGEKGAIYDAGRAYLADVIAAAEASTPHRDILRAAHLFRMPTPDDAERWSDEQLVTDEDLKAYRLPSYHPLR